MDAGVTAAADEKSGEAGPFGPDPIDLAIAPDGGVPFHPDAGRTIESPFAKPNAGPPVRVKVGMLLNSVDDYDVKTGTFAADFFLSLTSAVPMPTLNLQFPNGKLENKEVDRRQADVQALSPERHVQVAGRSPQVPVRLAGAARSSSRTTSAASTRSASSSTRSARSSRAASARVGWQVSFVEARSLSQSYPDRFEGDDLYYGRYIFTLGLDRFATSAAFKVFVPAFVIVIISLLGMWVPPSEMEVRSNSGAPMLAGAVLFHFALMQELPATSYLTRADKLMLGVYVSLALGMVSTWWMFLVKEENMDKVFRIARVVVPRRSRSS